MQRRDKIDSFLPSSLAYTYLAAAIDRLFLTTLLIYTMKNRQSNYLLVDLNNINNKVLSCKVLL